MAYISHLWKKWGEGMATHHKVKTQDGSWRSLFFTWSLLGICLLIFDIVLGQERLRKVRNNAMFPLSLPSFSHQLAKEPFKLFPTCGQSDRTVKSVALGSISSFSIMLQICSKAPLLPVSQSAVMTSIALLIQICYHNYATIDLNYAAFWKIMPNEGVQRKKRLCLV